MSPVTTSGKNKKREKTTSHKKSIGGVADRNKSSTPRAQSNLRHILSQAIPGQTPTPMSHSLKRSAADDASLDVPRAKKPRTSVSVASSASASTTLHPNDFYSDVDNETIVSRHNNPLSNVIGKTRGSSATTPSLSPPPASSSPPPSSPATSTRPGKKQASKKGWKGWTEIATDNMDTSRLLKIDEPIILHKTRQTRSGRKFADVQKNEDWEAPPGSWP